jgi:hypothetical protein
VPSTAARASLLLADLEPEHSKPSSAEMPCATSDFAEEHTISHIFLQVLRCGGVPRSARRSGPVCCAACAACAFVRYCEVRARLSCLPEHEPLRTHPRQGEMQGLARPGFWSRTFWAQTALGQPVVVKLYKSQRHISQRQIFDRFHRELTAMGTLGEAHPQGVVRCLGFGFTADLWPYIVMEHGGTPLAVVRRTTRVAALPLAQQLLESLEHVHMLGLSHNDLTEDNVVLLPASRANPPGLVAGAGKKILKHLRGETFAVRVVDWNSVEECTLAAGEVSGQRELLIQDTRQLVKTEAEKHPVVRDCQALGRMVLTCADFRLASEALKLVQVGSPDEWAAAAAVVSAAAPAAAVATLQRTDSAAQAAAAVASAATATHLPENWIIALALLLDPRSQWTVWSDKLVYPIPHARTLLAASNASGGYVKVLYIVDASFLARRAAEPVCVLAPACGIEAVLNVASRRQRLWKMLVPSSGCVLHWEKMACLHASMVT